MLKNKQVIILIISLLVLLSLSFFVIYPYGKKLTELKTTIHKERITLEQKKRQQDDVVELQKQFKELQKNSEQLNTAFISKDTDELIQIIEEIEQLTKTLKLQEDLTIPDIPTPDDTKTTESSITITLTGSYESIYTFIQELEIFPVYFSFDSVEISLSGDTDYRSVLSGTIYWK